MKQIFTILFLLSFAFVNAVTINIPADQPTIQAGINAAVNGDIVLVQPGTYFENINYNGKLITVASLFLTTQDTTYISSTTVNGNNIGSVVIFNSGEDSTTILCGFTITNGQAPNGGGIYIFGNSNPTVQNVIISINYAYTHGGGIYCFYSNPNLQNVTISSNFASGYGGGIYNYQSNPILENVTMTNNSASIGGGIFCNANSFPELINSILWNDSPQEITIASGSVTATYSDIEGGTGQPWFGTGCIDSNPLFVDPGNGDFHLSSNSPCIDAGDPASPLDPDGTMADMGAFYFSQYSGPTWHISTTGSDITGNGSEELPFATIQLGIDTSTDTDTVLVQPGTYVENINFNGKLITLGSLFLTTQDTTYLSSTIIDGNASGSVVTFENGEDFTTVLCGFTITNGYGNDGTGGGITCKNYFSNPSLENLTITGNNADYGGGIYCQEYCGPSITNVTITGNSAGYNGGGIYSYDFSYPSLINSILWNNPPEEIYTLNASSVTATYSDIQGGWTGTGNIDSDPLFVDAGNGDFRLQRTSPCIDAGDPASPLDLDGTTTDMGAYYYDQILNPFPPIAEFSADTINGYSPLTVNFIDTSEQGSEVIDEWYWDFGDENNSTIQSPTNEYLLPGNYTISLTVTDVNDSTDTETKVDYIIVYSTDPPAPPTDVQVDIVYPDAVISWTAVDTTLSGDPCITDGYIILYSENEDDYFYLWYTTDLSFIHEYVAQHSSQMFYNVLSYVDLSREDIQYLKNLNGTIRKIRWSDVKKHLK